MDLTPRLEKVGKGTNTTIEGIVNTDIVIATEYIGTSAIFKGKRYFGNDSKHKKSTAGWENLYFEFGEHNKPCSGITKKEVQKRAKFIDDISCTVARRSSSTKECGVLYTELIRLNKDVFDQSIKNAGYDLMETSTPQQAVNIQSLLRIPTNKMRNLRNCLSNFKSNILPSDRKIRKFKAPLVSHVNENSVESGFIGLRKRK